MTTCKQNFSMKAALVAGLLGLAGTASAGDKETINFTFKVLPTVCDITVNQASFTMPLVSTNNFAASGAAVPLSDLTSNVFAPAVFKVTCGGPVTVGFKVTDGAAGGVDADSPAGTLGLGLGFAPSASTPTAPIGYYKLVPSDWKAGGTTIAGTLQERALLTDTWAATAANEVLANTKMYTLSSLVTTPAAVVDFSLTPSLFINPKTKLDPAKTHTMAGSYTVTVVF